MEPLICKYMRVLYKDENEDVRSELVLALWEAITKIKYVENEGQCVTYLTNALRNKFYELYRNSRKEHDNYFSSEMTMLDFGSNTIFGLLVTVWFIINELISILENVGRMGAELPDFLKKALSELKNSIEDKEL